MTNKERSTIQEHLTTLYLRLNGYFTTGFIVHSREKQIDAELDILAVRFPLHQQDDTEHNSSEFLEVPACVDIVIGEVKSPGQSLQFNKRLRSLDNQEPMYKLLSWIGVFDNQQLAAIAPEVIRLMTPVENSQLKTLRTTEPVETKFGKVVVRPILFSPERPSLNNTDKFIHWTELNDFIWMCLCPDREREACGTTYDTTAWGQGLDEIVLAYKRQAKQKDKFSSITDLYGTIEEIRTAKTKQLEKVESTSTGLSKPE